MEVYGWFSVTIAAPAQGDQWYHIVVSDTHDRPGNRLTFHLH